jgi:hypothetical protein
MPGTRVPWTLDGSTGRLRVVVAATAVGLALLIVLLSAPRAEAVPIVSFEFDSSPPGISDLTVSPGDRRLDVSWHATPDVDSAEVTSTQMMTGVPAGGGVPAVPPQTIGGGATAAPGKLATRRLIAPGPRDVIKLGHLPVFRWVVVKRATYYNVQLFRAGRKALTAWPARPRYQLQKRWKFAGKTRRLGPGRYRWIVWPGFGPRSRANYGDPIGHSTFVVKR